MCRRMCRKHPTTGQIWVLIHAMTAEELYGTMSGTFRGTEPFCASVLTLEVEIVEATELLSDRALPIDSNQPVEEEDTVPQSSPLNDRIPLALHEESKYRSWNLTGKCTVLSRSVPPFQVDDIHSSVRDGLTRNLMKPHSHNYNKTPRSLW